MEVGRGASELPKRDTCQTAPLSLRQVKNRASVLTVGRPSASMVGALKGAAVEMKLVNREQLDDVELELQQWAHGFAAEVIRPTAAQNDQERLQPLEVQDRLSAFRASRHGTMVSNPALLHWYPNATVIPHVRPPRDMPAHVQRRVSVGFVGTPRRHKGVEILRDAVAEAGMHLVITADPPIDARPNEEWVGETSFEKGLRIVETADIVALPSLEVTWGRAQFPVKVLDAMMSGRAIIASDVAPLRWATNGAAVLVPPGDPAALLSSLRRLADADVRQDLGQRAHAEALARFTPSAVAPTWGELLQAAAATGFTQD